MAARLNEITSYLKGAQQSPLDRAMMARSLGGQSRVIKSQDAVAPSIYGSIPNVGQFNTPGTLPSNPSMPDPVLPNASGPPDYTLGNLDLDIPPADLNDPYRTAPSYPNPSLTIDPSIGSSLGGIGFSPSGVLQGGTNGPQGSVYGIDPRTGQPIYNVTGSPKPGFFDSTGGKILTTGASTALNMFIPGLGFVSKAIFDAIRKGNNNRNTGTDLTHQQRPTNVAPPASQGPPLPPGQLSPKQYAQQTFGGLTPTGYRDPTGSATFDSHAANLMTMWDQSRLQPTNRMNVGDSGRTKFAPGSVGQINEDTGLLQRVASSHVPAFVGSQGGLPLQGATGGNFNASLMQTPAYQAYMQRIAAARPAVPQLQWTPASG